MEVCCFISFPAKLVNSAISRDNVDKRARNEFKRQQSLTLERHGVPKDLPSHATKFPQNEIEAEERRPKRKVAVLLGYSGTGYRGMQINDKEKTIEGDLFAALVAAGAISKANADDPKKSALVRCARTDKGVHAAGNVVSLKLIVEDPEVITKINDKLPDTIRVWDIVRTTGSFSAYNLVDSRIYEYIIPSHCFLPPDPHSCLGRNLSSNAGSAEERNDFTSRQSDAADFWSTVEASIISPFLSGLKPAVRSLAMSSIHRSEQSNDCDGADPYGTTGMEENQGSGRTETASQQVTIDQSSDGYKSTSGPNYDDIKPKMRRDRSNIEKGEDTHEWRVLQSSEDSNDSDRDGQSHNLSQDCSDQHLAETAIKELRAAILGAKKGYRIKAVRLERIRSLLSAFVGTHNFHNYTIEKSYEDASARRVIKSFDVNGTPFVVNGTEWLSLKVHGQSFMMHQIRKMVSMTALIIRCGCDEACLENSYSSTLLNIPKAPALGLLLERPVFDTYNAKIQCDEEKSPIDFEKHVAQITEFKQRQIYDRIIEEEDRENQ
ncbi:tRNA pseudouridine synthase 1 [Agyrium rufum]|nr:tRNA pseudouridine synthase 1 [Agyrium rufum]